MIGVNATRLASAALEKVSFFLFLLVWKWTQLIPLCLSYTYTKLPQGHLMHEIGAHLNRVLAHGSGFWFCVLGLGFLGGGHQNLFGFKRPSTNLICMLVT